MHGSLKSEKVQVGLIMPIAPIDGCSAEHWIEVKSIFSEALANNEKYEFETRIVSESDSIGLIHKRIVQGIYNSDIVICDVSCKNPNVMFELGMRLAFDKPTVIVKDDKTSYSFDTSGIEHLEYPRDLRFSRIVEFKSLLERKVVATLEDSIKDSDYSPFLKSFGEFKVAKLNETEVAPIDLVFDKLAEIQTELSVLKQVRNAERQFKNRIGTFEKKLDTDDFIRASADQFISSIDPAAGIKLEDAVDYVIKNNIEKKLITELSPRLIGDILKSYYQLNGWPVY